MRAHLKILATLLTLAFGASHAQTVIPSFTPQLTYPPLARAARVQGDVVVSFNRTPAGATINVVAVSGHPLLAATAVANVKSWRFEPTPQLPAQANTVTFHFRLNPPDDGYDNGQPGTKVEFDDTGGVQVLSLRTTGLERSECPTPSERRPPAASLAGDFVELDRWNETVTVRLDGSITWTHGDISQKGQLVPAAAKSLLERFRTPAIWALCGHYEQAGLLDGGASSFKVRIGGIEKSVSEYGDAAPPIFGEVELAVDTFADTHKWRHGYPETESIAEMIFESLPKPGKTKLMDAARRGDQAAFHAALAAGDKLTDLDASNWTPLMYAASSSSDSLVREIVKTGVDVNARSKRGETALMASAVRGMTDEQLLNAGADVNAVNDVGMTALMLLVQRGDPSEIKTLLEAGADARKKDAAGRTALDYLNAANCGSPLVREKDPRFMTVGYSTCNALGADYQKSKRLLMKAGARQTRNFAP